MASRWKFPSPSGLIRSQFIMGDLPKKRQSKCAKGAARVACAQICITSPPLPRPDRARPALPQRLAATTSLLIYLAFSLVRRRYRAERLANRASQPVENPWNTIPVCSRGLTVAGRLPVVCRWRNASPRAFTDGARADAPVDAPAGAGRLKVPNGGEQPREWSWLR